MLDWRASSVPQSKTKRGLIATVVIHVQTTWNEISPVKKWLLRNACHANCLSSSCLCSVERAETQYPYSTCACALHAMPLAWRYMYHVNTYMYYIYEAPEVHLSCLTYNLPVFPRVTQFVPWLRERSPRCESVLWGRKTSVCGSEVTLGSGEGIICEGLQSFNGVSGNWREQRTRQGAHRGKTAKRYW